jgi:predicted DNA-binding transcriptional regulator AlpA
VAKADPQSTPSVARIPNGRRRRRRAGDEAANGLAAPPLLHEADAARYIGMSVAFLRQARVRARGPAYFRIGRSVRYRVSDLDAWLSERRVTTRDQTE